MKDGRITKHEHIGFFPKDQIQNEPNHDPDKKSEFMKTVGLFDRGFNGYPHQILKGFLSAAKEAGIVRQPVFVEGVTYRIDFSRDNLCGPTNNMISEVTPVAPGDAFCFYANEHWFVAYHIHEGFLHFMNKHWEKWPN